MILDREGYLLFSRTTLPVIVNFYVSYFDLFQQKALTDFLWSMTESDELSFAKVEDKLTRFKSSQQDEADCQLTNAVQKLLRLVSTNCAYSYKTLPTTLT